MLAKYLEFYEQTNEKCVKKKHIFPASRPKSLSAVLIQVQPENNQKQQ